MIDVADLRILVRTTPTNMALLTYRYCDFT